MTWDDLTFEVATPGIGNYLIAIYSDYLFHDDREYGLTVTATESTVLRESETNDTNELADALPLDEPIIGQLSTAHDQDIFAVTLDASSRLTLDFDGPTDSIWADYFRISLHDAAGNLLETRDTGADIAFDAHVDSAGTYYVTVSSVDDYFHSDEEYRLSVGAVLDDPIPAGAITGTKLGDKLTGSANDDLIYGLGGNDQINGGDGSDTVVFRTAGANLSINTVLGLTAVRGDYAAGEHAYSVSRVWNVEKINTQSGTEILPRIAATPLLGGKAGEVIRGTAGDDLIDGLGGNDFIDGGAGTDTLALFGAKDQFSVLTVAGITRIQGSEATHEYAGHGIKAVDVEALAFNQSQTMALETNASNKLFGTAAADILLGTGADDIFDGQGGNDQIDGGAGDDTIALFGRQADFNLTQPTATDARLVIKGKAGTAHANQTITATNVESIAFADGSLAVANPPRVILTPASTWLAEGGDGARLDISLSAAPTAAVTVNLAGGDQLSPGLNQLTFDAANWNTPQSVTIDAIDDPSGEKQHGGTLTVSVTSADAQYQNLAERTLGYTISDNDSATTGSVAGRLWNDFDKDGVLDGDESPLSGWSLFDDPNRNGQWDADEYGVITDVSGQYRLDDLTPGTHTIAARVQTGWTPTYPGANNNGATIITNTAASGEVGVEPLTSTVVSESEARDIYANLGSATNIAAFHADPRFTDIDGQGYTVVVIDTGIDLDHAYFGADNDGNGIADRIVYQYDFAGNNDATASDGHGHGTHVAGIIGASDARYPGIAPGVNLIALKVLSDSGQGDGDDIIEALNWVVGNVDQYNIVAVNLSLGDSSFYSTPSSGYLASQFKSLANMGVVAVSAAGNGYYDSGSRQGVSYPSADPYSLSVGAVWTGDGDYGGYQTGVTDAIAFFSQRDDTESDIFAPGVYIDSAAADGTHVQLSGTSMAAPEIAGMVALAQQLAERELGRRLSFDEIRTLLRDTGAAIVDGDDENDVVENTGLTFKRADMLALAEAIVALKPPVSHTVTISAGTTMADRNFGFTSSETVQALSADDLIYGTAFGEAMHGGAGADRISGGDGDDELHGEAGDDHLAADAGDDRLDGGDGADTLLGGGGADTLIGGTGNDSLDGGDGSDTASFDGARENYAITWSAASGSFTLVSDAEGTDTATGIEVFRFADGDYSGAQLADITAPGIAGASPASGASGVALGANLAIRFDEAIQRGTGNIVLKTAAGALVASFDAATSTRLTLAGDTLTIDPVTALLPGTAYRLELDAGSVRDLAGNACASAADYTFTTHATPVATPASAATDEDTAVSGSLAGTDVEGAPLSFIKLADPAHGKLTLSTDGQYTYTPGADFNGSDSFSFKVNDGELDSAPALVSLTVNAIADAPTAANVTLASKELAALTLGPSNFGFRDADGDALAAVRISDLPSAGLLEWHDGVAWRPVVLDQTFTRAELDAGSLRITPVAGPDGTPRAEFGFAVSDGASDSAQGYTLKVARGYALAGSVSYWKDASRKIPDVSVSAGELSCATDAAGAFSLDGVADDDGQLTLTPAKPTPASRAEAGISLSDVLAALKLYLGKSLPAQYSSPYNYIAADFDGEGGVTLSDVLNLLKYYLGKGTANNVQPTWVFVDTADLAPDQQDLVGADGQYLGKANTTPHAIDQDWSLDPDIELVGVLRGDVDGSW